MNILCISPVPSHPPNQGNARGIAALGRFLQLDGHRVHFIYATLEGLDARQAEQMKGFWDDCSFIDANAANRSKGDPEHWLLDDFYVDAIDPVVKSLTRRFDFQICIVHYVWFSAAFERLPSGTRRILYTHDRFGDRHRSFLDRSQSPTWFYTSRAEEARGLGRADLVLAVQEEEAIYFREITDVPVRVSGYLSPSRFIPARPLAPRIRAGFLASANATNILSLHLLGKALSAVPALFSSYDFVVGGTLCDAEVPGTGMITRVGFVEDRDSFYASLDLCLNPNVGGSGLKIKTVEAMSYGLPLVSTAEGMLGLPATVDEHRCSTLDELVAVLRQISLDRSRLETLRLLSHQIFSDYQILQWNSLRATFGALPRSSS